jgi:riboflavin biosynthesis pyrimidine reductase
MDTIQKLYPLPAQEIPLQGAYLSHDLRQYSESTNKPFIYANFVVSLDGRIAIPHPSGRGLTVPQATANARDWRLFQELAAQADLILSSGRYLREWAQGRAQEILRVDDPRFADLRQWRKARGLALLPDIAIISASLDFPIPPVLTAGGRKALFFTDAGSDPKRVEQIEAQAGQVIVAGESGVDGSLLVKHLARLGYHTVYSAAGPRILHLLAGKGVLDRLYLTYASRMLGGQPFSSILEGPTLTPALDLKIHHIYLDPQALDGSGQLFLSYDRI